MAATVSAWAKPGAWALDSEENEDELLQQGKDDTANAAGLNKPAANDAVALSDFPSLAAAASTKTKKKKPQILSLQEFSTYGSAKQHQQQSVGLTPDEIKSLPTGPRERTAEELDRSRLGGGFRSYGYDRSGRDETRRPRESNRDFAPSRADETDDWGATKKFTGGNGFERRERGERGGFFSDSQSRADDSDNWAAKKAFVPSEGRRFERRGSFESNGAGGDSDNWTKKKDEEGWKSKGEGGAFDSLRERRRSNGTDSDYWGKKVEEGSGGGGGNSRPRLNLQPRTLPIAEGQQNLQPRTLPIAEGQQNGNETAVKPKGSNPFGDARPREEVLKEKGQDWKEIDQKLESVKIKEVADGGSFRTKSFGSSNGRSRSPEEKSWRKPEVNDARPSSADKIEDKPVEEGVDAEHERDDIEEQEN